MAYFMDCEVSLKTTENYKTVAQVNWEMNLLEMILWIHISLCQDEKKNVQSILIGFCVFHFCDQSPVIVVSKTLSLN